MAMLTQDQLRDVATNALRAAAHHDGEGVIKAMKPLWRPTGDVGDGYLFTALMVNVVLDSLPPSKCSEHGEKCLSLGFGLVGVRPDGQPDWSDTHELDPEFAERFPAQASYLQMMAAEYQGDVQGTVDAFCAAVMAGHAPNLVWIAVQNAGQVFKRQLAALQ